MHRLLRPSRSTKDFRKAAKRCLSTPGADQGLPNNEVCKLEDADLAVKKTELAGRGIFASRDFRYGENLLKEKPLLCHPSFDNISQVCYHCLKGCFPGKNFLRVGREIKFCSQSCLEEAENSYLEVDIAYGEAGRILDAFCRQNNLRFPAMLKRLVCTAIQASNPKRLQVLDHLVHASKMSLENLISDHMIQTSLGLVYSGAKAYERENPKPKGQEITPEIWMDFLARTYSRLALNTFRVDGLLPDIKEDQKPNFPGLNVKPEILGSALYTTASLLNHSCAPNLNVVHPNNSGEVNFVAARDIEKGEEICITYIDATLPKEERQKQLHFNYGFHCRCDLCTEDSNSQAHSGI